MRIDRTGCTRIVVLVGQRAYKAPNFLSGWRLLLTGLLANMQERTFSKTGWPELCPVSWSIPGGWLVVMHRARVMTEDEFLAFDPETFCDRADYVIPAEWKANSFGYLGDRVVALDYGSVPGDRPRRPRTSYPFTETP